MGDAPSNTGLAILAVGAFLAAGLAGCHQMSAREKADQMIHSCAALADEYLDPQWKPRQVTGATADGVGAVISAQGTQVRVTCNVVSGYYTQMLGGVDTIEGVEPTPGQLYLPARHRWLTDEELRKRVSGLLAPRFGEYWGVKWAPPWPSDDAVISDLAGVPSNACFMLQSRLDPSRQLFACRVSAGYRYWISQGQLTLRLSTPPWGSPSIPTARPRPA